jgi:hypothetical protein
VSLFGPISVVLRGWAPLTTKIKRGFNRLFIVLTVVWAIYCMIVYPLNERGKAAVIYDRQLSACYQYEAGRGQAELNNCLHFAEGMFHDFADQWTFKNFYAHSWPFILAATVGLPLVVYGVGRGLAALSLWVYRGYRPKNTTRS